MNAILKKLSDTIDVTESTPLYIQVANAIREKIMNGELKEGANLAPEYELADDLNVSLITTKKALDILVKEKLIYRRPRLGTFVGNIKNRILITDTHKILFLFCNARIPDQYSSLLFSGVEQACKENNFSLKLLNDSFGLAKSSLTDFKIIINIKKKANGPVKPDNVIANVSRAIINLDFDSFPITINRVMSDRYH